MRSAQRVPSPQPSPRGRGRNSRSAAQAPSAPLWWTAAARWRRGPRGRHWRHWPRARHGRRAPRSRQRRTARSPPRGWSTSPTAWPRRRGRAQGSAARHRRGGGALHAAVGAEGQDRQAAGLVVAHHHDLGVVGARELHVASMPPSAGRHRSCRRSRFPGSCDAVRLDALALGFLLLAFDDQRVLLHLVRAMFLRTMASSTPGGRVMRLTSTSSSTIHSRSRAVSFGLNPWIRS